MSAGTGDTKRSAVVRAAHEHRRVESHGVSVGVVVSGDETLGRYSVVDYVASPGAPGPALHLHEAMDETFHVLEGAMTFSVGDRRAVVAAGGVVHVPAGVPHAFWNAASDACRMTITVAPAGLERYLIELLEIAKRHAGSATDIRPLIVQLGAKYDQVVLGPSPAIATAAATADNA